MQKLAKQKIVLIGVSLLIIILITIRLLFTEGKEKVDPCVATGMCEYNDMISRQKTIAERLSILGGQVDTEKAEYEKKLIEYQILKREYLAVREQTNILIDKSYNTGDIEEIEYQAEFLKYIDYEIPNYDPERTDLVYFNPGTTNEKHRMMNVAYQLGGEEFVLMLHSENQHRDHQKQSDCHGPRCEGPESGKARERSYGYCQLNIHSYRDFLSSKYFEDPEAQMIKCRNEWKKATENGNILTKFYGRNNRELYRDRFTFDK